MDSEWRALDIRLGNMAENMRKTLRFHASGQRAAMRAVWRVVDVRVAQAIAVARQEMESR
jgi:hypothetical protein